MKRLGVLALMAIAATGCGGGDDGPDSGAQLACMHFRNAAADYSDGVITLDEFRSKLAEVEDDASISDEPNIATGARAMLAAITQGDLETLAAEVTGFNAACTSAGA